MTSPAMQRAIQGAATAPAAKRKSRAKRRPAKPKAAAMPDLTKAAADKLAADVAAGRYDLKPRQANAGPGVHPEGVPQDRGVANGHGPSAPKAAASPQESPRTADEGGDPAEAPPHLIRMVHDDPGASLDGRPQDEWGGWIVPVGDVADLKGHGFRVQHLRERGLADGES